MKEIGDYALGEFRIKQILCRRVFNCIDSFIIIFDNEGTVFYVVDTITGELRREKTPVKRSKFVDFRTYYPDIPDVSERYLRWVWEMKNQNGYFDALQLEMTASDYDDSSLTLQLYAGASTIGLYLVSRCNPDFKVIQLEGRALQRAIERVLGRELVEYL